MRFAPSISGMALALVASGCLSKPKQLSKSWKLDRLRILAIRATPAEPRPGEPTRFDALVYAPDGGAVTTVWWACLPESSSDFGCSIDPQLADELNQAFSDPDSLTPDQYAQLYQQAVDAGLVGVDPPMTPAWTPPDDILDGLTDIEKNEGVNALLSVSAFPNSGGDTGVGGELVAPQDSGLANQVEFSFKRLPVSEAVTPNHNPDLKGFTVGDTAVEPDGTFAASKGKEYKLSATLSDDAVETYTYINSSGQREQRTEQPYITWYVEQGAIDQPWSLYPDTTVKWTAPDEQTTTRIIAVIRDRRGGMGWASFQASVN